MKKKSFTRALASISAAVLLAVSLTPQTIPAMAAENSVSEGSASQADQVDAAQPAAENEAQPAEANTVQIPEEQPEQSEAGEAETLAESNQGAENSQEASASDDSAATEEADAEETADAEEDAAEDQTIADTSMETAQPEEPVTVTYKASEGGHVSKESETFVKGADSAALTGAEAEAEDGYEFVDWTEDGVEVSTDAVFVPDVTAIDADTTFTANFKVKEVEETWPAVDFAPMTMSDGSEILVSAPEGAFPAGVQMRASVVEPESLVDAVRETVSDDVNVTADKIAAYDISFYLPDDPDTELEPKKEISVRFANVPLEEALSDGAVLEAYHVNDTGTAEKEGIVDQTADGSVSAEIKTDQFSVHMLFVSSLGSAGDGAGRISLPFEVQKDEATKTMQVYANWKVGEILNGLYQTYQQYNQHGELENHVLFTQNGEYKETKPITFQYTITFPDSVVVGDPVLTNSSAFLTVSADKQGNAVTFDFKVKVQQDASGVYYFRNLISDYEKNSGSTLTIHIPFAQKAGIPADTSGHPAIRATGTSFSLYPGRVAHMLGLGIRISVANTDTTYDTNMLELRGDALVAIEDPVNKKPASDYDYNTQNKDVFRVKPGAQLSVLATLDVSTIKELMNTLRKQYGYTDDSPVALSGTGSEFGLTLKVPPQLNFEQATYEFRGSSAFKMSQSENTVRMTLKDNISTFGELYQAICGEATDSTLKLYIHNVKVNDDAKGKFTLGGELTGSFSATASRYNREIPFSFDWKAVQDSNGKDWTQANGNDALQITFLAPNPVMLPGDALVSVADSNNFDSEHTALFETEQGANLDIAADLNVEPIQDLMEKMWKSLNEDSEVTLSQTSSNFQFTFNTPEGMSFPADIDSDHPTYELMGASAFGIKVQGNVVTMFLKDSDNYGTFEELYQAICKNTKPHLRLIIRGVKIADDAKEQLTVSGKVTGDFHAIASLNDASIPFEFTWASEQKPEGTDYILGDVKNPPIQLTVHVAEKPVPVTPETPKTPTSNPDTPAPTNGTPSSSGETPSPVNVTTPDSEVAPANTAKVLGASRPTNETVPVENMAQSPEPQKVLGVKRENHQIATGDDSQMMLYGLLALAAAAGVIIWLVRYRRRER
ncbi:MAG: hypothetical protein MR607_10030 [Lachnospiraceae bacterium]|nr:hypothetical protein [Lachnospiraceae bacterium]